MEDLLNFLVTVKDDREPWAIKHLLSDIVLLFFFARLSGAEYWGDIEEFVVPCQDISSKITASML